MQVGVSILVERNLSRRKVRLIRWEIEGLSRDSTHPIRVGGTPRTKFEEVADK